MKVYRLEHKDTCKGVYINGNTRNIIVNWVGNFQLRHPSHPSPYNDSLLNKRLQKNGKGFWSAKLFHYGFSSKKQFRNWFFCDETLARIAKEGMVVRVYDVPERFVGNTQAVFESRYHKPKYILETLPWGKFLGKYLLDKYKLT